jgi:hypothetical protein
VVHGWAGAAGTTSDVAVRPIDPPVEVPGYLLLPGDGGPDCLAALVTAFT